MQDTTQSKETVALVGAGPGDPELLTVKAHRRLQEADVVCHDNRISPEVLEPCPPEARILDVGKIPGEKSTSQRVINRLLVKEARSGRRVVRLKGGDPFVFGRGGEEALYLRERDVPVEIIPGISSCIGVPAAAGVPVTHRGVSTSFSVVTGMTATRELEALADEWRRLAETSGTLVFLMGVNRLDSIAEALLGAGVDAETPTAMIASGTLETQRTVDAPLDSIVDAVREADIAPPATFVVGEVADLRAELAPSHGPDSREEPRRRGSTRSESPPASLESS